MKLKNTLGLVIASLHTNHVRDDYAPVYYIQGRLIVSGWLVWSSSFDYRSRMHREMISPNRNLLNKALEQHHENSTANLNSNS